MQIEASGGICDDAQLANGLYEISNIWHFKAYNSFIVQ